MQILIGILFCLAVFSLIMQMSFLKEKSVVGLLLMAIGIGIFMAYPYAIEQSYSKFKMLLGNQNLMGDFLVLQVIESTLGLLFSIVLIRIFYKERVRRWFRYFKFFPGIIFIPALFYIESYLFLNITGFDFKVFASVLAVAIPLVLFALLKLILYLIPEYDLRLELKFILHILQLITAIVISIKIYRLPANTAINEVPYLQMLVLLAMTVLLGVLGVAMYNYRMKKQNQKL